MVFINLSYYNVQFVSFMKNTCTNYTVLSGMIVLIFDIINY